MAPPIPLLLGLLVLLPTLASAFTLTHLSHLETGNSKALSLDARRGVVAWVTAAPFTSRSSLVVHFLTGT